MLSGLLSVPIANHKGKWGYWRDFAVTISKLTQTSRLSKQGGVMQQNDNTQGVEQPMSKYIIFKAENTSTEQWKKMLLRYANAG